MRPNDTSEQAWARVEDGLRAMSPGERVRRALSLTVLAHSLALAKIRQRHPEEDPHRHRLRLAARYLEPSLMRKAFGWSDDGS